MNKSVNGAASFTQFSNVGHDDKHDLAFSPWNSNYIYICTDGGLWKFNVNDHTSIELNNGLGISQMYGGDCSEIEPTKILAGLQDNGLMFCNNSAWDHVVTSDGMGGLLDKENENYMYGTTYQGGNGTIHRSSDNWVSNSYINNSIENADYVPPLINDPINVKRLYQGRYNIWTATDGQTVNSNGWTKITETPPNSLWNIVPNLPSTGCPITALNMPSNRNDIIYGSFSCDYANYYLFKGTYNQSNSSWNWSNISPPAVSNNYGPIYAIASSSFDPNKIWVGYRSYQSYWKAKNSTDGGLTWTDYSDGLPNMPINCMVFVDGSLSDELFAGTDVGVFYRNKFMTQWEPFMENLPNVTVWWLDINYSERKILAFTHGRGVWQAPLPCFKSPDQTIINANLTLTAFNRSISDIRIEPGITLNLTGRLVTEVSGMLKC